MRVIAGQAKGKALLSVSKPGVRPALNRVKEALFGSLGECVVDARCADFFAGTGSLGIEALSRGARECVFVERSRSCVRILRRNLESTGMLDRAKVWQTDVFRCAPRMVREGVHLDVLLAAPPYALVRETASSQRLLRLFADLCERDVLREDAHVVLEHQAGDLAAPCVRGLAVEGRRRYGQTELTLWRRRLPVRD